MSRAFIVPLPGKVCPQCGRDLSVKFFNQDKTKPDRLQAVCRDCQRENWEKAKKKSPKSQRRAPMDGGTFFDVYADHELRDFIKTQAKRKTEDEETRKDLIQEAWLAVSMAPGDYCAEAYKEVARRAIESVFRKSRIHRARIESFTDGMSADDWLLWSRGVYELSGDYRD